MPELSISEISHLLAYREPNSFFRAFQGWTGRTPQQVRLGQQ
jgi:AraC-like DNA-binding protein